jgi:hypothetical protein
MNIFDNKIIIIDRKLTIKDYKYNIDNIADPVSKIKELIKSGIKDIPFSFIKSRIIVLVPDDINNEDRNKIIEIVYKTGKFREILFINEGLSIVTVFEELNRCIYLVEINDKILGFCAFAGQQITKIIYFDNNNSIDYMINQINNEIQESKLTELKTKIKNLDLDTLWKDNKIVISFEPEYYLNKKIENIKNNYVSDILNTGLIKCVMKIYYKNKVRTNSTQQGRIIL